MNLFFCALPEDTFATVTNKNQSHMNEQVFQRILENTRKAAEEAKRSADYAAIAAKTMLTIDDVCLLTGFGKQYVYKLTAAKQIPYYKPQGKTIYIKKEDLTAWMQQNRSSSEGEIAELANNAITQFNLKRKQP